MKIALTLQPDGRVGWYEPVTKCGPRGFVSDYATAEHVIEIEPSAILKTAALASVEAPHVDLGKDDAAAKAARDSGIISPVECMDRLVQNEIARGKERTGGADLSTFPNAATGAFYEFLCANTRFRSTAPVHLEFNPGYWCEVKYDRKPEPLRDADRLTYETVAEILRSHSSPTMGAPSSVHGGQRGFIVYEADGLPFIVSQLAELATLDDGRTARDMLHKQGSEIRRLEILADYQREELTRLEDMARLGLRETIVTENDVQIPFIAERPLRILVVGAPDAARNALIVEIANRLEVIRVKYSVCDTPYHYMGTGERVHALAAAPEITIEGVDPDFREIKQRTDDPAAGATLAAMMKERDELRASLPNFESRVAELTAAFDEALADMRRERDELREKLRRAHALDDSNQADAARRYSELREANDALNAKCMRQDTEIAALRDEIEGTRGKRNEWQRRAVTAERERDSARKMLTRVRDAAAEIVGNLQS